MGTALRDPNMFSFAFLDFSLGNFPPFIHSLIDVTVPFFDNAEPG